MDSYNRKLNQPIRFYLNGEIIGESICYEKSMSCDRISAAEKVGVKYYDRFIIRPGQDMEADSLKCIINGRPLNDFNNRIHINKK